MTSRQTGRDRVFRDITNVDINRGPRSPSSPSSRIPADRSGPPRTPNTLTGRSTPRNALSTGQSRIPALPPRALLRNTPSTTSGLTPSTSRPGRSRVPVPDRSASRITPKSRDPGTSIPRVPRSPGTTGHNNCSPQVEDEKEQEHGTQSRNHQFAKVRQRRRYLETQVEPKASVVIPQDLEDDIQEIHTGQALGNEDDVGEDADCDTTKSPTASEMTVALRPKVYSLELDGASGYHPLPTPFGMALNLCDSGISLSSLGMLNFKPLCDSGLFNSSLMDVHPDMHTWNIKVPDTLCTRELYNSHDTLLLISDNMPDAPNVPILIERSSVHIASAGSPFTRFRLLNQKIIRDDETNNRITEVEDCSESEDEPVKLEKIPSLEVQLEQFYQELSGYYSHVPSGALSGLLSGVLSSGANSNFSEPQTAGTDDTDIEFPIRAPQQRSWSIRLRTRFSLSLPEKTNDQPYGTFNGFDTARCGMDIDTAYRRSFDDLSRTTSKRVRLRKAFERLKQVVRNAA